MELNPDSFNAHLDHMGMSVDWRRAHACPCVNPRSGAANPACGVCRGKGHFWDGAVSGVVGFAGQKVQMAWAQFGRWESGDVVLSIPSNSPVYDIGRFDRVVMGHGSVPYTAVVMPGESLKFPVLSVERAFIVQNNAAVDIDMPAISADGDVSFPAGAIPAGAAVSLTGRRQPEYFCFGEYPQDRAFHHGADLPRRMVLRKFDLFSR